MKGRDITLEYRVDIFYVLFSNLFFLDRFNVNGKKGNEKIEGTHIKIFNRGHKYYFVFKKILLPESKRPCMVNVCVRVCSPRWEY